MSRKWRTIYNSPHRKVLVRPGAPRTRRTRTLFKTTIYQGLNWDYLLLELVGLLVFMLFFLATLEYWWIWLPILLAVVVISNDKQRPK